LGYPDIFALGSRERQHSPSGWDFCGSSPCILCTRRWDTGVCVSCPQLHRWAFGYHVHLQIRK